MKSRYKGYADEERPFNMAARLLMRCDLLFIKANEASVERDFYIWVSVLKALKRTISFKLSEDEKKELSKTLGSVYKTLAMKAPIDQTEKLDEIETKLISLMYNYGLYYPKYEKRAWEEEAEEEDV